MSVYVSQSGVRTPLQPDSCVCSGCDLDFSRNKTSDVRPKLRDDMYAEALHSMLYTGYKLWVYKGTRLGAIHMAW